MSIIDSAMKLTSLTKQGANYRGLCPFHDESTPSFVVRPQLNDFICFGCGKSGGEIELAEFEQQERGEGEWIEWGGGDNPAEGKFVQVRFRDGMVDDEQPSASYRWYHDPNDCDIIAYRVIENDGREG